VIDFGKFAADCAEARVAVSKMTSRKIKLPLSGAAIIVRKLCLLRQVLYSGLDKLARRRHKCFD
jgi:hypothetical protein